MPKNVYLYQAVYVRLGKIMKLLKYFLVYNVCIIGAAYANLAPCEPANAPYCQTDGASQCSSSRNRTNADVTVQTWNGTSRETKICGRNNNSDSVKDHTVLMVGYPLKNTCCRWGDRVTFHGAIEAFCSEFTFYRSIFNRNNERIRPFADVARQCWRWECRTGYFMTSNKECLTNTECTAKPDHVIDGPNCSRKNWDRGWSANEFDQEKHILHEVAGLQQFRCKSGGFVSNTNKTTCDPCEPTGHITGNGAVSSGIDKDGVCHKCQEFHYYDEDRQNCEPAAILSKNNMDKCWACPTKTDYARCFVAVGLNPNIANTSLPGPCQTKNTDE